MNLKRHLGDALFIFVNSSSLRRDHDFSDLTQNGQGTHEGIRIFAAIVLFNRGNFIANLYFVPGVRISIWPRLRKSSRYDHTKNGFVITICIIRAVNSVFHNRNQQHLLFGGVLSPFFGNIRNRSGYNSTNGGNIASSFPSSFRRCKTPGRSNVSIW